MSALRLFGDLNLFVRRTTARRLRAEARERGVSLAEMIRRYVEKGLAEETVDRAGRYERALRGVGRFRDRRGARDLSSRHDRYLDEAFE